MKMLRPVRAVVGSILGAVAFVALIVCLDSGAAVAYASLASVPARPVPAAQSARGRTLVVLGDSLGQGFMATPGNGWVDIFRRRLALAAPGSHVLNRSIGGSKVRDLVRQVDGLPAGTRADAVLVVAGGNDVMKVTEPLRLARDESALLSRVRARFPEAKLLVANIADLSWRAFHLQPGKPPVHLPLVPRVGLSMIDDVDNAVITRFAHRYDADIVDLHTLVSSGSGHSPGASRLSLDAFDDRYISSDGLHPNDRGYALLADYAWPQVARAMEVTP